MFRVIKELGYEPVRADQDTGALIITQMLERLYFADLVLADMTIPNGNVYYEVGIRHAAQASRAASCLPPTGPGSCSTSRRCGPSAIRCPRVKSGRETATAFGTAVKNGIAQLSPAAISPMHLALPGYPGPVDPLDASTMKDQMTALAAFQTKIRAVRVAPRNQRMQLAQQLIAADGSPPATYPIALALSALLRDSARKADDWKAVLAFLRALAEKFSNHA